MKKIGYAENDTMGVVRTYVRIDLARILLYTPVDWEREVIMADYKYDDLNPSQLTGNCAFIDERDGSFKRDVMLRYHIQHTLAKTNAMFEWNIPQPEIRQRDMELRIQTCGYTIIAPHNGKFYSLRGTLGGRPNFNYMPSWAVVANPYLKLFKTFKVYYGYEYGAEYSDLAELKEDCVVIPNDSLYVGLIPTLEMYFSRIVNTDISRRLITISSRAMNVLVARDEDTHKSIKDLIKDLYNGKISSIFADNILDESTAMSLPFAGGTNSQRAITELIESEQYDKAALMNELGLQANYNMKRESINSNEAQLAQDAILPFADNMLKERQRACELINEKFGLDWSVDFSSAWKIKREEIETSLEMQKKASQSTGNEQEDGDQSQSTGKEESNNEGDKDESSD